MWYTHVRLGYWSWKEDILTKTLDANIERWLTNSKQFSVKAATYDRLRCSKRLMEHYTIANLTLDELTSEDIQEYINRLVKDGYSFSTVKKQYTLLSAYLKWEYSKGGIRAPIYLNVNLPGKENVAMEEKEKDVFTQVEQAKLMKVLKTLEYPAYGAIALMLELGLRPGEAQTVMWNDILEDRKAIRIHRTLVRLSMDSGATFVQNSAKSETSNRIIPLSNAALNILERIRRSSDSLDGFIFPSARDSSMPITYFAVKYAMIKACERSGVRYRSVHTLRHTFATNCYNRGCDVKILSKLLGHSDVAITYNVYIHLYGDALEEMRKVIE